MIITCALHFRHRLRGGCGLDRKNGPYFSFKISAKSRLHSLWSAFSSADVSTETGCNEASTSLNAPYMGHLIKVHFMANRRPSVSNWKSWIRNTAHRCIRREIFHLVKNSEKRRRDFRQVVPRIFFLSYILIVSSCYCKLPNCKI